jgi:hypothetical protein
MNHCPGCGADTDPHMTTCWECHEPLENSPAAKDDLEFDHEDDDDLVAVSSNGTQKSATAEHAEPSQKPVAHLDHAADALLEASDDSNVEIPSTAVVAYVAQDEVQAGTISQLLTDCGIHNFATAQKDSPEDKDGEELLQVQVLQEDLAAAQQLIADFTAEFDDFS